MAIKFYHALNCNRRIGSLGRIFDFRPYAMICGTWCGLYATEDPGEQAALDALLADPRQAIQAIRREEHDERLGSKSRDASASYSPLLTRPIAPVAEPLVAGSKAIVIERPHPEPAQPVASSEPLSKALDALQLGSVQTPK